MTEELEAEALYRRLLQAWNERDAAAMAACFTPTGTMIGYDGSTIIGPDEIVRHLAPIFRDHPTAAYVAVLESVETLAPGVVLLRATAGLVPPGANDIVSDLNAIQTVVALDGASGWAIALYQNTPAAFHGRPELRDAMTANLRAVLREHPPR